MNEALDCRHKHAIKYLTNIQFAIILQIPSHSSFQLTHQAVFSCRSSLMRPVLLDMNQALDCCHKRAI